MAGRAVDREEILRKLAIHDDVYVGFILARGLHGTSASRLEPKDQAFARLGAMVGIDAAPPGYLSAVEEARAAGVTEDDIVGVLVALLPLIGVDQVASAAPALGLALGYDVDAALEEFDESN